MDMSADLSDWQKKMIFTAEDATVFNSTRILLLLDTISDSEHLDLERLGYYDFFSANPFLMIPEGTSEHPSLELAGVKSS